MAEWTTKYINSLPNSSFAVVEPAYLSGDTDDKNARHLPYKDASGKVDIPHLRNARARMNQIKPVTDSISTEELRAKAKKVLDAAAKKYLKESEMSGDIIHLSMDRASHIELVEDNKESPTYKIKFELMDVGTYNRFNFTEENLDYMVSEFNKDENGVVSHGLDHSWDTLDQIGKVYELVKEGKGDSAKVFASSELYKETEAQKQAYILFKQGLLKFVSGGWFPTSFKWNDETESIDITNPKLREISSTPMPAKQDARALEVLNSLNHSFKNGNNDENIEIEMSKEDKPMPGKIEPKDKPSEEGQEVSEQVSKLAALEAEYKAKIEAQDKLVAEMKEKADADVRVSLNKRAAELGLSEELFKDSTNDAMELALKAAKEVQVSELQKREPENNFGGEGEAALKDGSPEMIDFIAKEYYGFKEPKVVN